MRPQGPPNRVVSEWRLRLDRWFEDRIDWTDDLLGLVVVVVGIGSLVWLVACGPMTNSDQDVRYHCAQRMYGAHNDLAAEILFESCLTKYGKTP